MPKSNKRKKDKTADFTKAKLKLGKGKQLANNATDTSFKARSIALPHQTIGLDKDTSKPTTRRNLSLDDLLVHLKHYKSGTRKDAIWGIREILDANSHLVGSSLTPIIQSCARVVGDEDAEVRKTLLDFLSWYFRIAPIAQIMPHTPLLILFITSAQTHIFPAIRIDAVRFLDLLLEYTPETVTAGWAESDSTGSRVLEGYLGLLSAGSGFWAAHKEDVPIATTSSVTLSPNSKLVVLSSLANFLNTAISPSTSRQSHSIPTWYMASSFSTRADFQAFRSLIRPSTTSSSKKSTFEWSSNTSDLTNENFTGNFQCEGNDAINLGFSLEELGEIGQVVESLASDPVGISNLDPRSLHIARLARTLHPILLSTWLDVAPTVFGVGASGSGTEAQLAVSVGQIAGSLYGTMFRDLNLVWRTLTELHSLQPPTKPTDVRQTAVKDLAALLGYMSTYLPYVSETQETQSELLRSLSFAYCELTSLAVIESQREGGVESAKNSAFLTLKQRAALLTQINRVGDYVVQALDGKLKSASHPLGNSITASSYTSLLPTLWSLLEYQSASKDTVPNRICASTLKHAVRTSSRSGTKAAATQFVGLLVLLHTRSQASPAYRPVFTSDECELVREWYLQLPKVLWEVGTGDHLLTELILRLLLRIEQRPSYLFDEITIASVRSRLVPYFTTVHPHKGSLLGPFSRLKEWPHLRRLTLDVTFSLLRDAPSVDDELKLAVDKAVDDTADYQYWNTLLRSSTRLRASHER